MLVNFGTYEIFAFNNISIVWQLTKVACCHLPEQVLDSIQKFCLWK